MIKTQLLLFLFFFAVVTKEKFVLGIHIKPTQMFHFLMQVFQSCYNTVRQKKSEQGQIKITKDSNYLKR